MFVLLAFKLILNNSTLMMQQMQINSVKNNEILKIKEIKRNNKICETENSKFLREKS